MALTYEQAQSQGYGRFMGRMKDPGFRKRWQGIMQGTDRFSQQAFGSFWGKEAKGILANWQDYMQPVSAPTASTGTAAPGGMSASARAMWEKALAHYAPGGGYGKGVEAGLERGRVKSTASGMQNLVSAGLAGTTMAAGLGKKYEEEVAAPTRARVEGARAEAIANIQMGMAGAEQRGYETAQDRAFQLQMQQNQLGAQAAPRVMTQSIRRSDDSSPALQLALAKLKAKSQPGISAPTTHKASTFSFDGAPATKTPYQDPAVGQPAYSAIGTGMYLGGGKFLTPQQVGYGQ